MHIASCPDISSGGGGRGGTALGNSNSELESEDFLVCWFWKHCFVWTLGRGWDTEDVNFCICTLVLSEPITLRSTQPLKVSTRDLSWGKGGWCVWLTIYHPCSAEISRKFGTLIYPEPLGPHRPVAGRPFLLLFTFVLLPIFPSDRRDMISCLYNKVFWRFLGVLKSKVRQKSNYLLLNIQDWLLVSIYKVIIRPYWTVLIYEGWNFNSGNYLFTTDTK